MTIERGLRSRVRHVIWAIVLPALLTTGCTTTMMPTPVSFHEGNADPLAGLPPEDQRTDCEVYLITNRALSGESDPAEFYSNDRSREGRLAVATIDLAPGLRWDQLHRASVAENRAENPVPRLTKLEDLGPLWSTIPPVPGRLIRNPETIPGDTAPAMRFLKEVNAKLTPAGTRNIYVFVHGYNTEFAHNHEVAAQLYHYLGRDGVFMSYAWPTSRSTWPATPTAARSP
jgi:esterase/lipase superfamily enzyme